MEQLSTYLSGSLQTVQYLFLAIQVILHVVFAAAVARDAGHLEKTGAKTLLVSGVMWAFATLLGGVFVAVVYWVLHHSTLTRSNYS